LIDHLNRLAAVAVKLGVNVQPGQELIITAPLEAAQFVRYAARAAYRLGASTVTCLYDDADLLMDHSGATCEAVRKPATSWIADGVAAALAGGAARLFVYGPRPDLLQGVDQARIIAAHQVMTECRRKETEHIAQNWTNWSSVPFATQSWADLVSPTLTPDAALISLWDAIYAACRVGAAEADMNDVLVDWQTHLQKQTSRRDALTACAFNALRFRADGTDLRVGLAPAHSWRGGETLASNGVRCVTAFPSEALFTAPHCLKADGRVALTRPIAIAGGLVEDAVITFRNGSLESIAARRGDATLDRLLSIDPGGRRLGKIALVPQSSPIGSRRRSYFNPLLDGAAATYLTFGQTDASCLGPDGIGGNISAMRIDAMFGCAQLEVDGIRSDNSIQPLMRCGEFVS
jgi:aminopeptidase